MSHSDWGTNMSEKTRSAEAVQQRATEHRIGFTLIEILVVVAIIALLIAILLPALTAARNEAYSAQCLSNLKQVGNGLQMHLVEQGMRKERISTNYGWATYSYRANQGAGKLFMCPADTNPKPIPPLFADIYEGSDYRGRVASDGVFNTIRPNPAGGNLLDIQDSVNDTWFGRDASDGTGDVDLLLKYTTDKGATTTDVGVQQVDSSWSFRVLNHKGQLMWANPSSGVPTQRLPLMWLSYGANASAGLREMKGNPILLIENRNPGVFPEDFRVRGGRPADKLKQVLRFRHGARNNVPGFKDPQDSTYVARERASSLFYDGHGERLHYKQIIDPAAPEPSTNKTTGEPLYARTLWIGTRRTSNIRFD